MTYLHEKTVELASSIELIFGNHTVQLQSCKCGILHYTYFVLILLGDCKVNEGFKLAKCHDIVTIINTIHSRDLHSCYTLTHITWCVMRAGLENLSLKACCYGNESFFAQ